MFSVLCDVITYDGSSWLYIDGFPCKLLDELESVSGHPFTDDVIVSLVADVTAGICFRF